MRNQSGTRATTKIVSFSEAGVQELKGFREENDRVGTYRDQDVKTDEDLLYNFPVVYVIKDEQNSNT